MAIKQTSKYILIILSLLISGCVSDPYNQGNYVDVSLIQGKEGIWTRVDVEKTIGSPSLVDPKDPSIVYYVGAQGYKYPLVSPTVQKALTLKLEYNNQLKLKKITIIE
jgi:outer membrane protein assembly factor BamE (lipoprotein component of BamABCDE complex)